MAGADEEQVHHRMVAGAGARLTGVRVTIVAANTFVHDARQLRTADALAGDGHDVVCIGYADPGLPTTEDLPSGAHVRRIEIDRTIAAAFRPLPLFARRLACRALGIDPTWTSLPPDRPRGADRLRAPIRRLVEIVSHARRVGPWADAVLAAAPDTDVFHAKALIVLPVVRAAAGVNGARFVYDLADIHTEAARLGRMPGWFRGLVRRRERRWMLDAAALTAVSDGVADEVARRFGVPRPVVVLNTPPAWRPDEALPEPGGRLRELAGVPPGRPLVLYQGGFSVDRGIEELVAAVEAPSLRDLDVALVFMGYGRLGRWLADRAAGSPRIVVLDAVPPGELLALTVDADVGYVGQPPRTLNQRLNLANKLFEYIGAGVPVVVARDTAHCRLVTREGLGRCVDIETPAAIGAAIADLLTAEPDARQELRRHVRAVALQRYTWEVGRGPLIDLYRGIGTRGRPTGARGRPAGAR
jgi:glycosyltransferase involved in cell wall biosynthesis